MNDSGYNGDMLDVVPRDVEEAEIPSDEEAQIEHIVKNKLINKPGGSSGQDWLWQIVGADGGGCSKEGDW